MYIRLANKPNKYPWNANPHSKLDSPEENNIEALDKKKVVKIKPDKSLMRQQLDKRFINWESLNQLAVPTFEESAKGE
jgi:hypothetical protein